MRDGDGSRPWCVVVASAGVDFEAAIHTRREIVPAVQYTEEQMLLDTAGGIPETTMPQMRQAALLALIRSTLPDRGESLTLTQHWEATSSWGGNNTPKL